MATLRLPVSTFQDEKREPIGIDCGGSLIKVAAMKLTDDEKYYDVILESFSNDKMEQMIQGLKKMVDIDNKKRSTINATGVHILPYTDRVKEVTGKSISLKDELSAFIVTFTSLAKILPKQEMVYDKDEEAIKQAKINLNHSYESLKYWRDSANMQFRHLTRQMSKEEICDVLHVPACDKTPYAESDQGLYPCILAQLGSCGVLYRVDADSKKRFVSMNPVLGKTILGLSTLLTGESNFEEILKYAEKGDSSKLDTLMTHIADGNAEGKSDNVYTAGMNFGDYRLYTLGRVNPAEKEQYKKEDILAATLGMLLETLAMWIEGHALHEKVNRVFLIGSPINSPYIRRELTKFLNGRIWSRGEDYNIEYNFCKNSKHYGALGALFMD